MTLEQTRQLGIEFERRILTMIPNKEYIDKLDTETIYSYLNQYLYKYVHSIYRSLDDIPSGSKLSAHFESVLQSMLTTQNLKVEEGQTSDTNVVDSNDITIVDTARSYTFKLPENFYMYIRSVSLVNRTFSYIGKDDSASILPNQLVSQSDVWKLVETPHNSLRILRYPAVVINQKTDDLPTLTVIYDRYTNVKGVRVMYYKQPAYFDVMTDVACELPMDTFEELVSGAVDLYVQYAAGAEANARRQQEAARQQQKQNNDKEDEQS